MKIQEYQAKELFARYDIPVNRGILCYSVEEAAKAYDELGSPVAVVKAQVLSGGRGKAGGVKLAKSKEELITHAGNILGMDIKGFVVDRVLIVPGEQIASEYYMSYVIDRNTKSTLMMLSREGGVDIEEVARVTPEKIHKIPIGPAVGVPDFLARKAAFLLFDEIKQVNQAADILKKLYRLFVESDASLAEINPLILTANGDVLAIDAKMTFDYNAKFRHEDIVAMEEPIEEERKELDAKSKGFSYVRLDGEIGCMVNGAGSAMATMDLIKLYGGNPANFLNIGGSSNPHKVINAMKLLLSDKNVKVVFINIFCGIMRCDDVVKGLLAAFEELKTDIPIVIRLSGINEQEGRALLQGTKLNVGHTMSEAAKMAVELAQ